MPDEPTPEQRIATLEAENQRLREQVARSKPEPVGPDRLQRYYDRADRERAGAGGEGGEGQ